MRGRSWSQPGLWRLSRGDAEKCGRGHGDVRGGVSGGVLGIGLLVGGRWGVFVRVRVRVTPQVWV